MCREVWRGYGGQASVGLSLIERMPAAVSASPGRLAIPRVDKVAPTRERVLRLGWRLHRIGFRFPGTLHTRRNDVRQSAVTV